MVLLVKTLGLTASFDSNFADIKPDDYYYQSIGIAKKLAPKRLFSCTRYTTRSRYEEQATSQARGQFSLANKKNVPLLA